jgi:RimJ/RimL family protein N-acetyltransferase
MHTVYSESCMAHEISLRDVQDCDLPVFFEQQLDPDAARMAAFPSRDYDAFMAHWSKIKSDGTTVIKTIVADGEVAGNIVKWEQAGDGAVGYWLGKEYWGQGIASAALSQFLALVKARPLHAYVAKHNLGSIRVLQKCGFTISGEAKFSGVDGEPGEELILTLAASGEIKGDGIGIL